jgi:DNA invertase Pin-like site-specific DNA recombinase
MEHLAQSCLIVNHERKKVFGTLGESGGHFHAKKRGRKRILTRTDCETIIDLRESGCPIAEIAIELGVSESTIKRQLKRENEEWKQLVHFKARNRE